MKFPGLLKVSMGPADGQERPPKPKKQKKAKGANEASFKDAETQVTSPTVVVTGPAAAAVAAAPAAAPAPSATNGSAHGALPRPGAGQDTIDLERRRDQLTQRVAELQWDLGGLVYEMAIRDRIRVDVIVRRAAALQNADAELAEVERILRLEQTSTAGQCASCGSPHSSGAAYCWQCGQPLLQQVASDRIAQPNPS